MGKPLRFDYYYGIEAEQFTFYRVPRLLIKDTRFKNLSCEAKLLYGLILDRLSLSLKNGWLDDQNRAFIHYTLENIVDDLCCSTGKCVKVLAELDVRKGIGLIERKKQGLGKPDIIYVKNFDSITDEKLPESEDETHAETVESQEFAESKVLTFKFCKSRLTKNGNPEFPKLQVWSFRKRNSGLPRIAI